MDPDNWRLVYALGEASVYRSDDAGQNWVDITSGLPLKQTRTIDTVSRTSSTSALVAVGGSYGVFLSSQAGNGPWQRLGDNLPNVIVNDLRYYPAATRKRGPSGDILVAGTIGRGVWSWIWNAWRVNLSQSRGFEEHSWRGAWGSDGPIVLGDLNGDGKTDVLMWRDDEIAGR